MMHGKDVRPRSTCGGRRIRSGLLLTNLIVILWTPLCSGAPYRLTIKPDDRFAIRIPAKDAYDEGEIVQLVPRPDTGYSFAGWGGDVQEKRLVLNLAMDSDKTVIANFSSWRPPIGVPDPNFGIFETCRMYDDPSIRNPALTYQASDDGGYFTHYVDNTNPAATNTNNTYGSKAKPRWSIPESLPAGSICEVHGGTSDHPYTYGSLSGGFRYAWFDGRGTAASPVFIRGATGTRPKILSVRIKLAGTYFVVENLEFENGTIGENKAKLGNHHIAVRNLIIHGSGPNAPTCIGLGQGRCMVAYNNFVYDNGDVELSPNEDVHAVFCGSNARKVWIVDNYMYDNLGDAVQICSSSPNAPVADYFARYIYIGRNVMCGRGENAIDLKSCRDVISSENCAYGFAKTPGSDGAAMVVNDDYTHENIWFINNRVWDCVNAFRFHDAAYMINNVSESCGLTVYHPIGDITVINNTFYNGVIAFGSDCDTITAHIHNNIVVRTGTATNLVKILSAAAAGRSTMSNNLLYQVGGPARISWGRESANLYESLAAFQKRTGKGVGCVEADPQFINDQGSHIHLQSTSPAIDAGTSADGVQEVFDKFEQLYGVNIRKDIEGRTRTGAWDTGAYECVLAAITDLSVSSTSQDFVTVAWTVPGEQGGMGKPARYDIRYSTSPLTEGNWEPATPVPSGPTPGAVGDHQSFTITGLNPGTTYYIAIKTSTEAGGTVSSLSNVVAETTTAVVPPAGTGTGNGTSGEPPASDQTGSDPGGSSAADDKPVDSQPPTDTGGQVADQMAPVVQEFYPPADEVQVPLNPLIAFTIADAGSGVDANSVSIQVDGQTVYAGDRAVYETAYGTCRRTGARASYSYDFHSAHVFNFDQQVSVCVLASDRARNAMTPVIYQFTTEMQSFGRNEPVSTDGSGTGHPAVATDSHGNIWATWHAGQMNARDVYIAKRSSQTQRWDAPVQLTSLSSDQCNPAIVIGPDDALYVAWQDNRRGNWDIYVSASRNGGAWQEPVRMTDSNDNQVNPAIAVDQASPNRVYTAWEDDSAGNRDICLALSSSSFAAKTITRVTSDAADQTGPVLVVGSGNIAYLVWTDQRNGSADIYGSSSGVSAWANVPIVTGPGNQSDPAIAVEPGTSLLHMLWVDDTAGNLDILYGASNGLPAGPLSGRTIVDDSAAADQFAPAIVIAKDHQNTNHIYACWHDNRSVGESTDSDLYFAEIRSGAIRTNVLVGDDGVNSNQGEPALGFDEYGQPVVLWVDNRSNATGVYAACSTYPKPEALASALIPASEGGEVGKDPVSSSNNTTVSVRIPSNACRFDTVFSIMQMRNPPSFRSASITGYEIGPSGMQFSVPITVTIPRIGSISGQGVPYWYNPQTGTLSQLGMTNVTNSLLPNGVPVVSFTTTHLTTFYVLERPAGGADSEGEEDGGGCALSPSQHVDIVGFLLPYAALAPYVLFLRRKDLGRRSQA
jgi:hypothetical protein